MVEKRFKVKITKILLAQADAIKKAFLKHMKEKKNDNKGMSEEEGEKLANEITLAISYSVDGLQESMIKELEPLWIASGEAGNEYFNLIQFTKPEDGTLFDIIRQDYLDWLEKYGALKVTQVNDTTKGLTRRLIREGLRAGCSTSQIAEELASQISEYSKSRAVLISETEIHNSFSKGNFMTAQASGFKYKTWITAGDGHVRDTHKALNNKKIKIDQDFKSGLGHPGDSRAPARETIRCRCVLYFE
ncbi:phage minor head protein [Clostridium magnum]|uniref:phage minor head protein n=1 Tax=Clostridium magnum TaxID=33954 RepID=UPI000912882C|nr:phage minor head protein [Clostridium magnum]SHJ13861.1 Phage Mu protein F like protein [Clostridium magnum DSM 2767]